MNGGKKSKNREGKSKTPSSPRNAGGLIPTDPLPPRRAFVQVILLLGIPALLLLVARFVLTHFFPSLGY